MNDFLDIAYNCLNKHGEELCGDRVKVLRMEDRTVIVLSDGLGSGVKANILSTMTSEIIVTMWRNRVPLRDILETVIGTLPVCMERGIAYATFTIAEIDHADNAFRIVNFDNPPVLFFRQGTESPLPQREERIFERRIVSAEGRLGRGDFLAMSSDGVLYAGLGTRLNFGWGRKAVSDFIEDQFALVTPTARFVVDKVLKETDELYASQPGDDATFVGLLARERHAIMVFTGPPLDEADDVVAAERLINFPGRKIVCGGTTGSIIARYKGEAIKTDVSTLRRDVPPIGRLRGVDLLTEGLITMIRSVELIRELVTQGKPIPDDRNGAVMLARELLRADSVHFLIGQSINEFYQNPSLPTNISLRKNLIEDLAEMLRAMNKEIRVEFC